MTARELAIELMKLDDLDAPVVLRGRDHTFRDVSIAGLEDAQVTFAVDGSREGYCEPEDINVMLEEVLVLE